MRVSNGASHAARLRRPGYDLQDRRDHVYRVPRAALRPAAAPQAYGPRRDEWPEERQGLLRLFRRSAQGPRPRRLTRTHPTLTPKVRMLGYDWPRFHAAVNDLPAALLFVTVLFDIAAWLTKRDSLKSAALWTLWAGVIGGWVAVLAGLKAEDAIEHGEAIHELMETHETLALITMGIFTAVLAWKLFRRSKLTGAEEAGHHHEAGEAEEHEHAAPADTAKPAGHTHAPGTPPHKH